MRNSSIRRPTDLTASHGARVQAQLLSYLSIFDFAPGMHSRADFDGRSFPEFREHDMMGPDQPVRQAGYSGRRGDTLHGKECTLLKLGQIAEVFPLQLDAVDVTART